MDLKSYLNNQDSTPTQEEPIVAVEPLAPIEDKKPKPTKGLTDFLDSEVELEEAKYKVDVKQGIKKAPAQVSEAQQLSDKYKVPTSFVERNIEAFKEKDQVDKFDKARRDNPSLGKWLNSPERVAYAKDDMESLNNISLMAQKFKPKKKEEGFIDDLARGVSNNYKQVSMGFDLSRLALGAGDSRELAESIASQNKEIALRQKGDPSYYKEYRKQAGKEFPELQAKFAETINQLEKDWEGDILKNLSKLGSSSADTVEELFDTIQLMGKSPKALAYGASQSLVNSFAPSLLGLVASIPAAKLGAGLGTIALPGVGTVTGGALAGGGAFFATATSSGAMLEFSLELNGILQDKYNVDMSDADAIQKAFNDPKIIAEAKAMASRKAITTAAVDSLFSIAGGTILKGAFKGGSIGAKLGKVATAQAVDAVGEGAGEFAGQVAREGSIAEANLGEAIEEGAISLITAGGIGAVSYASATSDNLRKTLSDSTAKAVGQVKAVYEKGQEALNFRQDLDELVETVSSSTTLDFDPSSINELVDESGAKSVVYFQAEDFENHWGELDENALEKADELLPGGRADLQTSLENGTPLKVSLSDFVTKFKDEESFTGLADIARRTPESISASQAEAISSNIPSLLKELSKEAKSELKKVNKQRDSRKAVESDVEGQLIEAGLDSKDSKVLGQVYASNINALATAVGIDPVAFYNAKGLEVQSFESIDQAVEQRAIAQEAAEQGEGLLFQEEYRDSHTAPVPVPEQSNTGDDLTNIFPDIYSTSKQLLMRYYGFHDANMDGKALDIIAKMKGNPNETVTIYRAVPNDDKITQIHSGDWVAITQEYADLHGESRFDGNYKVLKAEVVASEIASAGDLQEWGWSSRDGSSLESESTGGIPVDLQGRYQERVDYYVDEGFDQESAEFEAREELIDEGLLLQNEDSKTRGFLDISKEDKLVLGLLGDANKSTTLHEFGHAFLENLKTAANFLTDVSEEFTPQQARLEQDIKSLLDHFGIESLDQVEVKHHEEFARLTEAFFLEGKAPSKRLQRAFNTFKTWLMNIYKNLAGIERAGGVKLNMSPKLREMFNRMLATQEEISEVLEESGAGKQELESFYDILATNDEDREALEVAHEEARGEAERLLYKKQLEQIKKRETKDFKVKKKELTKKYQEIADSSPLYNAIDSIKFNKVGDRSVREIVNPSESFKPLELSDLPEDMRLEAEGYIEDQISQMVSEVEQAEAGERSGFQQLTDEGIKNISTSKKSTFPQWFRDLEGIKTKKDFIEAANRGKFARYNRIKETARQLLIDGYVDGQGIQVEPDNDFRSMLGYNDFGEQSPPAFFNNIKFNTEALKQYISKEQFRSFPRSLYSSDGIEPSLVAGVVGFNSGQELIDQIATNPNKKEFIKLSTQQELDTIFPNFMNPSQELALKEEAINSVANDKKDSALRMEFELLLRNSPTQAKKLIAKLAKRLPNSKQFVARAEALLGSTKIKDARSFQFRSIEQKARREAGVALVKGDLEKASRSKLQEMLNYQLSRKAKDFEIRLEKDFKNIKKRFNKSDKDIAKSRHLDMVKTAQTILARYGLISNVRVGQLDTYLSQLKNYDALAFGKVEALATSLVEIGPQDYKELTIEQYSDVMDVVDALYDLAKSEKQFTIGGEKIDKDKLIADLNANISSQPKQAITKEDTLYKKFKGFVSSLEATMTRVEHMFRSFDKGSLEGPFTKYLWTRANEGQIAYQDMLENKTEKLNNILKAHFKDVFKSTDIINLQKHFTGIDKEMSELRPYELVMALIHSGNDGNKKKLLIGRNWGNLDADGNLDTTQYDAFLDAMIDEGHITKSTMDGVQAIWDLFEEIKPDIQKTHKEVYGYFFNEVEATPVQTPWGEYRGGYAPAVTDPLLVEAEASRQNELSVEQQNNQFTFAHTPKGFTKERVAAYNKALSLDFRIVKGHIEKSVRFATLEGVVTDLNKIINNKTFSDNLFAVNTNWGNEVLRPWLGRIATQQSTSPSDTKSGRSLTKALGMVRSNANMQLMFFNLVNTTENILETTALFTRIKGKSAIGALNRYMKSPSEAANMVKELSPSMRQRMEQNIFEMNDTYRDLSTNRNKFQELQDVARKNTYIMQQAVQNVIEVTGWMGAYDESIANGMTQDQAVKFADATIRQVMGSGRAIDMAKIEAGNALQKVLLTFYSFFLNKWNLVKYSTKEEKLRTYALGAMAPAILSAAYRKALRGGDGDNEYIDDVADVLIMSQVRFGAAMFPFGGSALRFVEGQLNDKVYDDRLSLSPLVGAIEAVRGVPALLTRDELKSRDVRDTLNFFGTISGLPLGYFGKPIGYMIDVEQGKQSADDAVDLVKGITTGRSRRK